MGVMPFEVPSSWQISFINHGHPGPRPLGETLLSSLTDPCGLPPLGGQLAGADVLIIVSDVTRYTGAERVLPIIQKEFLGRAARTRVLFALGNHRKQTESERRGLVSDGVYEAFPCIDHDCFDEKASLQ